MIITYPWHLQLAVNNDKHTCFWLKNVLLGTKAVIIEVIILKIILNKKSFSLCKKLFSLTNQPWNKHNVEVRWNDPKNPIKVQNHWNTLETILSTVLQERLFQMLQKMLKPSKTKRYHILFYGNLILTNRRTLKDWFYLKMVSHRAINDIMQIP